MKLEDLYFLAKDSVMDNPCRNRAKKYAGRRAFQLVISEDLISKVEPWLIRNCIVLKSNCLREKVAAQPYLTSNNSWCDYSYGKVLGAKYFFVAKNPSVEAELTSKINCKDAYTEWTHIVDKEYSYLKKNIWHNEYLNK